MPIISRNSQSEDGDPTGRESAAIAAFTQGCASSIVRGRCVDRAVDFFVDWVGSALSGRGQRAIVALEKFAQAMGPADGLRRSSSRGR